MAANLEALMRDDGDDFSPEPALTMTASPGGSRAGFNNDDDDNDEPVMVTAEQLLARRSAPVGQSLSSPFSIFLISF